MKFVIFASFFVVAAFASPIVEEIAPNFNAVADTRFLVFTRFNPTIGQVINFRDMGTVAATNFQSSRPTRILIHGWNG